MNNIAMPATIRAQPCGACSFRRVNCLTNCFWAPYIKPGEEEKFSLLVEDTSVDSLKARVKKCGKDIRQKFIDRLYEDKKKTKSEHEKAKAVLAADSESLNQHKGIAVVDVAEDFLNHHEGKVVHDFGIGLKTCKHVPTPSSTKSCSNVAEDSLNHHEGKAVHDFGFKWAANKRVRTCRPTKSRSFSSFLTPIPLAEKVVGPSDSQLLLLARSAEIYEVADMLFEMANDVDQKAKQAEKEQASLRNEKAEQSEKEQASPSNEKAEQSEKEQASLRNEKAELGEKEQAERPEK